MKKVPSVYKHSMTSIYLSPSAQLAEGTIFKKSPVPCIRVNIFFKYVIPYFCTERMSVLVALITQSISEGLMKVINQDKIVIS